MDRLKQGKVNKTMPQATKKYNVKDAKAFLAQFKDEDDVRGFARVKVVAKPVVVSAKGTAPEPPALPKEQ